MTPSLSTLQLFVDIVETGSLSAGARRHDLALSSASHRLRQLERSLGAALLNRTTRTLSLTEEGATYLQGCREALEAMNLAEDRLHRRHPQIAARYCRCAEVGRTRKRAGRLPAHAVGSLRGDGKRPLPPSAPAGTGRLAQVVV